MYTYTKRLDVVKYECFVGIQYTKQQFFINEAGQHCQRNIDPIKYGMKMERIDSCVKNRSMSMNFYHTHTFLQELNHNFPNDLSNMSTFQQDTLHLEMSIMPNSSVPDLSHELFLLQNDSKLPNNNKISNTNIRNEYKDKNNDSQSSINNSDNETIQLNETGINSIEQININLKSTQTINKIMTTTVRTTPLVTSTTAKIPSDAKVNKKSEDTNAMGNTGCVKNYPLNIILIVYFSFSIMVIQEIF